MTTTTLDRMRLRFKIKVRFSDALLAWQNNTKTKNAKHLQVQLHAKRFRQQGFSVGIHFLVSRLQLLLSSSGFKSSRFWISGSEYISEHLCIVMQFIWVNFEFNFVISHLQTERTDRSRKRSINFSVGLPQSVDAFVSDMSVRTNSP